MILEVLTFPNDILRKKSVALQTVTEEMRQLAHDMADTMYSQKGLGLAAPQVGVNVCLVVVDATGGEEEGNLHYLFNPVVINGEGEQFGDEGCLSIPGEYEKVRRFMKVTVKALDIEGNEIEVHAEGLLARAMQHEIDHLNGVLFIDHLPPYKRDIVKKHIKKRIAEGDYGNQESVQS